MGGRGSCLLDPHEISTILNDCIQSYSLEIEAQRNASEWCDLFMLCVCCVHYLVMRSPLKISRQSNEMMANTIE